MYLRNAPIIAHYTRRKGTKYHTISTSLSDKFSYLIINKTLMIPSTCLNLQTVDRKPTNDQRHLSTSDRCLSYIYIYKRLRWSRGSVLAFSTQVRRFKPGRSRRIFRAKKSSARLPLGGEVKPSVPCRRYAACTRSLNLCGNWNLGKSTGQFLAHSSTFRCKYLSRRTGTWRRKWERLKAGESNGKLPPRICPGCSVPEPCENTNPSGRARVLRRSFSGQKVQ